MQLDESSKLSAEQDRLASLRRMLSIGGPSSDDYVRTLRLARQLLRVDIAYVSVIDEHCQCLAAVSGDSIDEIPREHALCHRAVALGQLLTCDDTLADPEFRANPLVTQPPFVRSFAAMPIRSAEGQFIGALCVADGAARIWDVEQRRALEDLAFFLETMIALRFLAGSHGQALLQVGELVRVAHTDALTQLHNRRGITEMAYHAYTRCHLEGRGFAIALADLDHFKRINDTYGHDAGDAGLVAAAARLRQAVRGDDLVGRWGGEEFLIILPALAPGELAALGARLVHAVRGAVQAGDHQFTLSASIGIAWSDARAQRFDLHALAKEADAALYHAKHTGRDRCEIAPIAPEQQLQAAPGSTLHCRQHANKS